MSKLVREDEDFPHKKIKNLASAMQLNERYNWKYGKVKFKCVISFYYYYLQNLGGAQRRFPPKCIENTFKAVHSTSLSLKCILSGANT